MSVSALKQQRNSNSKLGKYFRKLFSFSRFIAWMPTVLRKPFKRKLNWLIGDGEMANLISSKDWSKTPLGRIESWPQSLRTTVSLCIASNFPINIVWGSDAIQIYNDGYRVLCGDAHPRTLGESYRETWASAWPAIGEPFERAQKGETSYLENQRMFLNRNGYLEETFFTFSLSPIRCEKGNVVGLFHPVTETTPAMIAQRRLGLLRELAESSGRSKSIQEACLLAVNVLSKHSADLPFCLLYSFDDTEKSARLIGNFGLPTNSKACQEIVNFEALGYYSWPFEKILNSKKFEPIHDFENRFGTFPCSTYTESLKSAALIPIRVAEHEMALGALVVGISTRLPFDDAYSEFLTSLTATLGLVVSDAYAAEKVQRRADSLAEIDRTKTAFLSNVSHEFRTPLTLMLGPLEENIADKGGTSPLHLERDQVAYRNAQRLLRLVDSLLDFSRIEAGRAEVTFRSTDLSVLTGNLASGFRSMIEKAGLNFKVNTGDLAESAFVDRELWEKIVLNLLSNAYKFTFQGEIELSLLRRKKQFVLTVRDTGSGIPEVELPNIFQRFHRVEGAHGRSLDGSGIGLALVRELVNLHGGSIAVKSQVGLGTEFEVRIPTGFNHLPADRVSTDQVPLGIGKILASVVEEAEGWTLTQSVKEEQEASPEDQSVVRSLHSRDTSPRRPRILVADDNSDMRSYLESLLRDSCDVEMVPDGIAAWQAIQKQLPDLILSDVMMPNLNGIELVNRLRVNPRTKGIGIILLSAKADEKSRIHGLKMGADDYLAKPFSANELLARVAANLKLTEARRETEIERQRLSDVFMQTPLPMVVLLGAEHRYFLANEPYEKMVGRKVIGKTVLEAFTMEEVGSFMPLLDGVYLTGIPYIGEALRLSVPDSNGMPRECFLNISYHPFRGRNGEIKGVLAVHQDVTELIKSRKKIEATVRELNDERELRDQFVATLTHDLRTPLAVAKMGAQLLIAENDPDTVLEVSSRISENMDRADRMIRDLLDSNRLKAGEMLDLWREEFRIDQELESTVKDLREIYGSRFVINSEVGSLTLSCDRNALHRIIENLAGNAVKYGSATDPITLTLKNEDSCFELSVHNEGPVISPADQKILFDVYRRTESAQTGGKLGWGIGLTLVKGLTESLGGTVRIQSEAGEGTTFFVRLPHHLDRQISTHSSEEHQVHT